MSFLWASGDKEVEVDFVKVSDGQTFMRITMCEGEKIKVVRRIEIELDSAGRNSFARWIAEQIGPANRLVP